MAHIESDVSEDRRFEQLPSTPAPRHEHLPSTPSRIVLAEKDGQWKHVWSYIGTNSYQRLPQPASGRAHLFSPCDVHSHVGQLQERRRVAAVGREY